MRLYRSALITTCLVTLGISNSTHSTILEELVITAQKREESLQDVAISVSAISGDQMEALGFTNAQQVTALTAGVSTIQPNGEANYSITIRGVANSDYTTNVESPVALYVDEVYKSQTSGTGFMLFDMERVEILRGPQGTLFGRNATGGLAHFITRKPSHDTEAYVKASYGDNSQIKLEGAIGGSLSDTLSARVSLSHHKNDGFIENVFPGSGSEKLNNADDQAWRFQLLFEPNENLSLLLNYRGSQQDIRTGFWEHRVTENGLFVPTDSPNLCCFGENVAGVTGYVESDQNTDPFSGSFGEPGFNELDTNGLSATINWDLGFASLTSITDASNVERRYIEDAEGSPGFLNNFFLTTDAEQISQELRLSGDTEKFNWVGGLYYLDLDISDSNGIITEFYADNPTAGFGATTPTNGGVFNPYTRSLESISVFGQGDFFISDTLKLTAGARIINDEQTFEYFGFLADFPGFVPGTGRSSGSRNFDQGMTIVDNLVLNEIGSESFRSSRDDTEVAIRLALNWTPNEDSLYYFSFNRGVKSGGFNAPIFPFAAAGLGYDEETMVFDPEELDAYEFGFKRSFAEGAARVNGSIYYYDYSNYQAFEAVELDTLTRNAQADSQGFELELQTSPIDGLDIALGYAYTDIDVTLESGLRTTSVQTPEHNFNALMRYQWSVGDGNLAVQVDADYRSEVFFALQPSEVVTQDGYTLANAVISYTGAEDKWSVSANINNFTDKEYLVQALDFQAFLGVTEQYYGRPRWWSLSYKYNF